MRRNGQKGRKLRRGGGGFGTPLAGDSHQSKKKGRRKEILGKKRKGFEMRGGRGILSFSRWEAAQAVPRRPPLTRTRRIKRQKREQHVGGTRKKGEIEKEERAGVGGRGGGGSRGRRYRVHG